MKNLFATLVPIILVAIAAVFGYNLDPEGALLQSIVGFTSDLPPGVQGGILVGLLLLAVLPHIAAFTPWTWDDFAIKHKGVATQLFAKLWNALAANYGKATNKGES